MQAEGARQLVLELAPPEPPSFASYVPGRNAAAVQALQRALSGGEPFVYLWGASGSGKTHLLAAFAAAGAGADLRVAAADDVERLDPPGQTALFDLYNTLRVSGGALAAAGDAPPDGLRLREDLRSRLGSGIVLQLHPLSESEKAAALRARAKDRGIDLSGNVIAYLLTHLQRDMGTQIAVLDALDRHSLEHKRPITVPLVRQALRELDSADPKKKNRQSLPDIAGPDKDGP
jgi:DnaA-homolog protein